MLPEIPALSLGQERFVTSQTSLSYTVSSSLASLSYRVRPGLTASSWKKTSAIFINFRVTVTVWANVVLS